MKLPGYCTECRRFKNVRVSNAGMAMLAARRVATGVCDACQDEQDARRRRSPRGGEK